MYPGFYLPLDMFVWLLLFWCFWPYGVIAPRFFDCDDYIQYKEPVVPLRGFDFKIAGLLTNVGLTNRTGNQAALIPAAAICQVHFINEGMTDIKLDGKLRITFQEYNRLYQSPQYVFMKVLEGNLLNTTTNQTMRPEFANTNMYLGSIGQGNSRIDAAMSGGFGLPFITAGNLAQTDAISNILYFNNIVNHTMYEIRVSFNYTVVDALLSFLMSMNWTLVGAIYETTLYGFLSSEQTLIYQNAHSEPYFACRTLVNTVDATSVFYGGGGVDAFCECLANNYDKIEVVVVFATLDNAYGLTKIIEERCNNPGYTYIVTTENAFTPERVASAVTPLSNSILIRSFYHWDIKTYFEDCLDIVPIDDRDYIKSSLEVFFRENFNCAILFPNDTSLPICPLNISERTFDCHCPISDYNTGETAMPELFYAVDSVSTVASALSLLQNNCTYLNTMQEAYRPNLEPIDFCALTEITPDIMNYAVHVTNFTGYTGGISFPPNGRARLNRDYFFYQLQPHLNNLTYFGNYGIYGGSFNLAKLEFPNGVPVSRIIYDNPDLNDAVVAVFFSFSIVFIVAYSVVLIILALNHDNKVLRRNSPLITMIMCCGLLSGAVTMLLYSLGASDALCWSILLIESIGFCFLVGGVIAKNYRIYLIFSNESVEALKIPTWKLCLFIIGMIVFFELLCLFVLLNGFGARANISSSNPFYRYISCSADSDTWNTIYAIVTISCRIAFLLVACTLSFLTRNVRTVYNESRELALIAYSFLMAYVLLLPIFYILTDSTNSELLKYVVRIEQLFIVESISLLVYFIPLIVRMHCARKIPE